MMLKQKKFSLQSRSKEFEEDHGLVYYREKRKLRSPPGYEFERCKKKANLGIEKLITLHEGSLLKMCFKYVSRNLEILESLIGLPEIVGKELFNFILNDGVLYLQSVPLANEHNLKESHKLRCLSSFTEAFGEVVLHSLSLTSLRGPMASVSKLLLCFEYLEELDLSGNMLDDEVLTSFHNLHRYIFHDILRDRLFPVGKIAEKVVCRSVFLLAILPTGLAVPILSVIDILNAYTFV